MGQMKMQLSVSQKRTSALINEISNVKEIINVLHVGFNATVNRIALITVTKKCVVCFQILISILLLNCKIWL